MAGLFSNAVKLADLDDFIAPSNACIKPVAPLDDAAATGVRLEMDGHFDQIEAVLHRGAASSRVAAPSAKITLNDCLACSGCITSAEAVLVEQQSVDELLRALEAEPSRHVIVSISESSLTSLFAAGIPGSRRELGTALEKVLKRRFKRDAITVIDQQSARHVTLIAAAKEFVERYHAAKRDKESGNVPQSLPVLAGECPGWVCYAEKTASKPQKDSVASTATDILSHISNIRSPQQVLGALLKRRLIENATVYHVAVMPCFDKKLEASRSDYAVDELRDVDLVLSTAELHQFLGEELAKATSDDDVYRSSAAIESEPWLAELQSASWRSEASPDALGSNGYCEFVFRYAAKELFDATFDPSTPLEFETKRNSDWAEVSLTIDGKRLLRFAIAYGFRNIQNVVRKIRHNACPYHYIEVMACPGGCLNGAGQVRIERPELSSNRALLAEMRKLHSQSRTAILPNSDPVAMKIVNEVICGDADRRELLAATYHAVAPIDESTSLAIKW
jgi:iron only hydrogenase large subunit-like protein